MNRLYICEDIIDEGKRVDQFLASKLGQQTSRSIIQNIIKTSGIQLNGKKIYKPNIVLKKGDAVECDLPEDKGFSIVGESLPIQIIYEDDVLIVVNKAAGMVVHPGAGNKEGTLVHALIGANKSLSDMGGEERPGIVHRLDKDTSGLILIAKNNQAHRVLSDMFSARDIRKEYVAIVEGSVEYEEGVIDAAIKRDDKARTKMCIAKYESKYSKPSVTEYQVEKRFKYSTLLKIHPLTGRTHQIRVHMSHIGHPILYDVMYGKKRKSDKRLALHAFRLKFNHPVSNKELSFEAPLPKELELIIEEESVR